MKTSLTSELTRCLQGLVGMARQIRSAFDHYSGEPHHQTEREHDASEATLFCENLEARLSDDFLAGGAERESCRTMLADFQTAAEQADSLARTFRRHGGDARLADALALVAEALRFSMPPLLRWCHGFRGREAWKTVSRLQKRLVKTIASLNPCVIAV